MLRERRLSVLGVGVSVLSLSLWGVGLGLPMVSQAATGDTSTYYLHGTSSDDANRLSGTPSSTFNGTAPTGTTDATQSSAPGAIPAPEWVGTAVPQGIYARSFTVTTYWSTVNPEDLIIGLDVDLKVYTGATITKDGVTDGTLLAQTNPAAPQNFADVGPNPTGFTVTLDCLGYGTDGACVAPAGGFVGTNLVVVAAPHYTDDGTAAQVHYDSTSAPSKFTVTEGTPPSGGGGPGSPACQGDFCMSAPLVLPKSGQTGGLTDTCYNPCGEPSMAVSPAADGTIYVSTPRTLVACCNTQASPVWKSTDNGRTWSKPIFPTGAEHATTGGDTELAVDKRGQVYEGELWLGSDSIYISGANGDTSKWDWSPASHDLVADREWFVYSPIEDALYGYYDGIKGLMVVKAPLNTPLGSHSGQFFTQERIAVPLWLDCPGVVAGPCVQKPKQVPDEVNGTPVLNGAISPGRPSASPVDGTVYFPFPYQVAGKGIGLAKTTDGLNFTYAYVQGAGHGVFGDTGNDFPVTAVGSDGTLYVAWIEDKGDGFNLYYAASPDKGTNWTTPVEVSKDVSKTAVFPNIVAGAPGQIAVSWYGNQEKNDPNNVGGNSAWDVFATTITDAASASPTLTTLDVQQGFHHGPICTHGLGCDPPETRNLLDFFDMQFDKSGGLGMVWTRDQGNNPALTEIAYSYQTGGCHLTADCSLSPALPEFPTQIAPVFLGVAVIGGLLLFRRRRRQLSLPS